ncbi:MAG TPA: NAD(P)/FAD-dependent oxidoreductase [Thermoanaerobaculales bacterium]|nr:NAD(P)/FAD-dependent oxidoreductase [Thermoanaerobaculales bacterium]HQL31069.1 NAD(P)/FAD-dependent oxidoreductase [Thermoanaerobaculales bacterium]
MSDRDLVIVGGGPAGLATAIRGRLAGLGVTVLDGSQPPIDRPCGEGLMPEGADQLEALGVRVVEGRQRAFYGIRYLDGATVAEGLFDGRPGVGIRRPVLHEALTGRAAALGADLQWGCEVRGLTERGVDTERGEVRGRLVVGADGRGSRVRRWAGLDGRPPRAGRFGVRRHYRMAPWSDRVEVHWGDGCEAYVTPVAADLVGVVLMWSGRAGGFDDLLARLPSLAGRVAGAPSASRDAGAGPFGARARTVAAGRVALVGDAACCLDPITGEGVALALGSADALIAAIAAGDLGRYRSAQARLARAPARLNRLVQLLEKRPRLRRRVITGLASRPQLFNRFLAARRGTAATAGGAVLLLGWQLLGPGQ